MRQLLSAIFVLCSAAPTVAETLDGHWIGFAENAILSGAMIPVIEEMAVADGVAVQEGWRVVASGEGCFSPDVPCGRPVPIGTARLVTGGGTLTATAEGPQVVPLDHPADMAIWPEVALVGAPWSIEHGPDQVVLRRPAVFDGLPVLATQVYWRAPEGSAGALFLYLFESELPVSRALCGLVALRQDADAWAAFFERVARLRPVLAEMHRLAPLGSRVPQAVFRQMTLRLGPESLGERAAPVDDLPADARAEVVAHFEALRAELRPDWLRTLAHPATPDLIAAEAACLDRTGG